MRAQGFTLLEMIVVLVLLGIIASTGAIMVQRPIEAYRDVLVRQELVDQADNALRQLVRDVRQALPNSVRAVSISGGGWALEMTHTVDGGRYRDQNGGGFNGAANRLNFTSAAGDDSFNLLGAFAYASGAAGERLVIYNTSPQTFYDNASANANPGVITPSGTTLSLSSVAGTSVTEQRITLSAPFRFSQPSPGQRLFVVDTPVSYVCDPLDGDLQRYDNYSFSSAQPTSAAAAPLSSASSQVMATQILTCDIDYQAGSSQRSDTLRVGLSLQDSQTGEQIRLFHQVHVQNVP